MSHNQNADQVLMNNAIGNPNLIPYRVMLQEDPGDKFQIAFDCQAEDDDHAVEQAENAYPGCEIVSYLPFGQQEIEIAQLQKNVAICINCMLQDDARGQTMVFVREDSNLIPKVVSADSIDLKNLQQYEMILFDGGNSAGDTWKHAFFPKQKQHCFVDENPLSGKSLAPCAMDVSLDGGKTWQQAPEGVRVVYKDVMIDGEDGRGEVHFNATREGLITDIWVNGECDGPGTSPTDYNIGTDSALIGDIVTRLVGDNA